MLFGAVTITSGVILLLLAILLVVMIANRL